MFEFVKNLNLKLNKVISGNKVNEGKKNVEGVSYEADLELQKEIDLWLKAIALDSFSFTNVLLKLGVKQDKILYLKKDSDSNKLIINYGYENKIDNSKKIILSDNYNGWNPNYGEVTVIDGNCCRCYYIHAIKDKDENDDFEVVMVKELITKNVNGITFTNSYSAHGIIINIKKEDGFNIELKCKGNFNFKIKNELELENYLFELELPIDVFLVYKRICEISLDDKIALSNFKLTVNRNKKVLASLIEEKEVMSSNVCQLSSKFNIKDSNRYISYNRYSSNNMFIRFLGEDAYFVKLNVQNGDYEFSLAVKPFDSKEKDYKLDNEIELRDYLLYLEFPIQIDEVFKKICEISLGDISRYSLIKLDCYYNEKKISSLYFRDGSFNFYENTRDGKVISVNSDGRFTYQSKNGKNYCFMEIIDNTIKKYEYASENEISMDTDNRILNPLDMVINDVKEERVKTRKLIDRIIK